MKQYIQKKRKKHLLIIIMLALITAGQTKTRMTTFPIGLHVLQVIVI